MPLHSTYLYALALMTAPSPNALQLVSGLLGLAVLVTMYFIAVEMKLGPFALVPPLVLLGSSVFIQAWGDVRPYMAAGISVACGVLLLHRGIELRDRRFTVVSMLFFASAAAFQALFLLALLVPVAFLGLELVSGRSKPKVAWMAGAALTATFLPWFVYRYALAGTDFYRAPYTWIYAEGFWQATNREILNRPAPGSNEYFAFFFQHQLASILPASLLILMIPVALQARWNRSIILCFVWLATFLMPFALARVPTEARYLFPLALPISLLAGHGLKIVFNHLPRGIGFASISLVVVVTAFSGVGATEKLEEETAAALANHAELEALEASMGEGKVYFRSYAIAPAFMGHELHTVTDFSEGEARTFLRWESEEAVLELLSKYSIRYLVLQRPFAVWEKTFHSWLELDGGAPARHYVEIQDSACFEALLETPNYFAYAVRCSP